MARKFRQVLLRSFYRMAQKWHDCSECGFSIGPGEFYHGYVYANTRTIWVEKRHDYDCTYDPMDDEELWDEDEEDQEKAA